MGFEAMSLAVMSALHLTGSLAGGSSAGIPEALICFVLVCGTVGLARGSRRMARGTIGFAIVGFIIGLNFTLGDGNAIDIAYHVTVLPLLVLTLLALLSKPTRNAGAGVTASHSVRHALPQKGHHDQRHHT